MLQDRHYQDEFLAEFWSYVDQSAGDRYCWLWMGQRTWNGYGYLGKVSAPIIAHDTTHGPLTKGLVRAHQCGLSCCVNPFHLFAESQSKNVLDGIDVGNEGLSLTEEDLALIRNSKLPWYVIADELNLTPVVVWRVLYGLPKRRVEMQKVGGVIPSKRFRPPAKRPQWIT